MKIGSRTIILNETFIIPRDELVSFQITPPSGEISVEVSFPEHLSNPVSWEFKDGLLKMQFAPMQPSVSPVVLKKPFKLGSVSGSLLGFTFMIQNVAGNHILHITFLSGGSYDE